MPVRRDLTGYTYELEGWGDSSSSGVFLGAPSPSCMVERRKGKGENKRKEYEEGDPRGEKGLGTIQREEAQQTEITRSCGFQTRAGIMSPAAVGSDNSLRRLWGERARWGEEREGERLLQTMWTGHSD